MDILFTDGLNFYSYDVVAFPTSRENSERLKILRFIAFLAVGFAYISEFCNRTLSSYIFLTLSLTIFEIVFYVACGIS